MMTRAIRVNDIVGKLRELGEMMNDKHVVRKLMCVITMRTQLGVEGVRLDRHHHRDVLGLEHPTRRKAQATTSMTRLLLMEEQWEACCRQRASKEEARDNNGGSRGDKHEKDNDDTSSTPI
jgi:hypothetical protein